MKRPSRQKIDGYDYEFDDQGQLFSTNDTPGYGIGYQIMPSRTNSKTKPTYKLTKNGGSITCRVDVLVEQYCTCCETFDSKWYWRTRLGATDHNKELRTAFLERKAKGLPHPKAKKAKAEKEVAAYVFIPWSNPNELDKCMKIEAEYSAAIGGDSRDASMCPIR
ncbi:hypothetical protein [Maridesulfovibrio salexigens]|uniref:Uncharacterized protein n=1 Tax=Maridesulfovibrio salexigens (strain ATCC 14822 / DSM 2638 / NCIMB 8403 / VKM B-1763) TaxID=526222 RepID=C6BW09_MARSD|nr:hypothetical protein [Maridesulfovibrio salexigens]ACS80212.1 hypothetical protein Desal_2154 [Maridesulfovibrio salexigens DSM 2638]